MRFIKLFTIAFLFCFALLAVVGLGSDALTGDLPRLLGVAGLAAMQALAVALLDSVFLKGQSTPLPDQPSVFNA